MKDQNEMLARAIAIAAEAHSKDLDKGGKAYILHPIRVMQRLRTSDPELMQIAILHDVVEDHGDNLVKGKSDRYYNNLYLQEQGFSFRVREAVEMLTHKSCDSYESYIRNIALNEDAIRVKLEDLRDNSDITRLKGISEKDIQRIEKYHKAYLYLKQKLKTGYTDGKDNFTKWSEGLRED